MRTAFTLLCLAMSATALPAKSQAASFTGLGFLLPGLPCCEPFSQAFGVSADGSVVVGESENQAFRWTAAGGMAGLGFLPGSTTSYAFGVSADGSVVVGEDVANANPILEAFRWTAGEGMVGLGFLPGEADDLIADLPDDTGDQLFSVALAVSADGSVVVGGVSAPPDASNEVEEGFRWTAAGGMVGLGFLPVVQPSGGSQSIAIGLSADGSVPVGFSGPIDPNLDREAFRWTAAGGMVGLGGIFGSFPGSFSRAEGVSADGTVVVGFSNGVASFNAEAWRWTAEGGIALLGVLPGGTFSAAYSVSADGSVVVGDGDGTAVPSGGEVIWDPIHGLRNLQDVLVNTYGLNLTGWNLAASGGSIRISADGSTIVGSGVDPSGLSEGWVAVIPRPNVQIEVEPFVPKDPIILTSPLPIPVAVLGSSTVDVTKIDVTKLQFGPKGATPVFTQTVSVGGQVDLVALFRVQDTGLAVGNKQACLLGDIGGEFFRGCDDVVVKMRGRSGLSR